MPWAGTEDAIEESESLPDKAEWGRVCESFYSVSFTLEVCGSPLAS